MHEIERWLEWPEWAKDAVVVDVQEIRFDWRERLMILFGRPVDVTTKAHTEHVVGRSHGQARVTVRHIYWPWTRRPFAVSDARGEREPGV